MIFGVALLAICTLVGALLGELLGVLLGVRSNVGGVGLAMILLIAARLFLVRRGRLTSEVRFGVEFWGALYIPIVVAMAAQQDVLVALRGGPLAAAAAVITVALCFGCVRLLGALVGEEPLPDDAVAIGDER